MDGLEANTVVRYLIRTWEEVNGSRRWGRSPLPGPWRGMRGIRARVRLVDGDYPSEGAVGLENERFWVWWMK